MIQRIKVILKDDPYIIVIGHDVLGDMSRYLKPLDLGKDAVIISHSMIERLHGARLAAGLRKAGYTVKSLNVPEGEKSKSAAYALRLIEQIAAYDIDKKIFIIALGGGVVGDLAGFVAAIYKRGIPCIQVPTTLLAQIDSAIGGKTAIDLKAGKNLVGAFHQPKLVFADTKVLTTLNARQIKNGLAEAVKYGVISDASLFKYIEANHARFLKGDPKVLLHIVKRCAQIKADVVGADEKETKGLRTILNFGHTVGHAIESAARYDQYHHGESVGLGMRVAARISVAMGLLTAVDEARINALITAVGLPERIEKSKISRHP
jgi:3-dehydroquinate synthase